LPVTALREFFADREPVDGRRKPIFHLVRPHIRYLADGRAVSVGDHLRGERQFEWRGIKITIGVQGIHYSSPESFPFAAFDDDLSPPPDDTDDLITAGDLGAILRRPIWRKRAVTFRKGNPTSSELQSPLANFGNKGYREYREEDLVGWTSRRTD